MSNYEYDIIQNNASSSDPQNKAKPKIPVGLEIDPTELYFGSMIVGEDQLVRNFKVTNIGKKTIRINSVTLESEEAFILHGSFPDLLKPSEYFEMSLEYTSDVLGLKTALVIIDSSDREEPYILKATARVIGSYEITAIYDDLSARITEESIVRANADEAEATKRLEMEVSLKDEITATVLEETTARVNADEALVSRIEEIETNYVDADDVTGIANSIATAKVNDEAFARANADNALSGRIESIESTYIDNSAATGIATSVATALVESEAEARADADDALASRLDTVEANYIDATEAGSIANALVQSEANTRANEDLALASRIDTIEAEYETTDGVNTKINAAITTESTARANADTALSNRASALEAQMTGASPSTLKSMITNEESARVNEDIALANRSSILESQMANTASSGLRTRIANEESARVSGDTANANRSTTLEAQMAGTSASGLRTRIINEETARISGDGALASRASTLEAQMAGTTSSGLRASIQTLESAVASHDGKLSAYWQVTAVAGGRAQLKVWANANSGAGVDITGDTSINGNLLVTGSVDTPTITGNAINDISVLTLASNVSLIRFASTNILTFNKSRILTNSIVRVSAYIDFYTDDDAVGTFTIAALNGASVVKSKAYRFEIGGTQRGIGMALLYELIIDDYVGPITGYRISYFNNGGDYVNIATANSGSFICVQEIKR